MLDENVSMTITTKGMALLLLDAARPGLSVVAIGALLDRAARELGIASEVIGHGPGSRQTATRIAEHALRLDTQ